MREAGPNPVFDSRLTFPLFSKGMCAVGCAGQLAGWAEWSSVLRSDWGPLKRVCVTAGDFYRPPPRNCSQPHPGNKHCGQASDVLAPVSRSYPGGRSPHVADSRGLLPIWPWVLRLALSSCQMTLLVVSEPLPPLSLSQRILIVTTGICSPRKWPR